MKQKEFKLILDHETHEKDVSQHGKSKLSKVPNEANILMLAD